MRGDGRAESNDDLLPQLSFLLTVAFKLTLKSDETDRTRSETVIVGPPFALLLNLDNGFVVLPRLVFVLNIAIVEPVDLDGLVAVGPHADESARFAGVNVLEHFHASSDSRLLLGS